MTQIPLEPKSSHKGAKGFMRRVTGSLGLRLVLMGINFVTAMVLARLLGPDEYGIYVFALTMMAIIGMPGQSGMPLLAVREISYYQVDRNWALMRGFLIRQRQFILAWSALAILGGIVVLQFLPPSSDSSALFWVLLLMPAFTLVAVTGAALRGLQLVMIGQVIETTLRPFLFLIALGLGLWLSGVVVPTAASVLVWHVGAAVLALAIGLWVQRRSLPIETRTMAPEYDSLRWLKALLPLTMIGAVQTIGMKSDIVMLRFMADPAEIAYYQVALQLAAGVLFANQAIVMVAGPRIARLWRKNNLAQIQQVLTWSARYSFLTALPLALALILIGPWLVELLFGESYAPAYMIFVVLCVGRVIISSYGVLVQLLQLTNWAGIMVKLLLIGVALNIVLNLLLIPSFGAAGAATSAVIATVVWKSLALYEARRRMGLVSFVMGKSRFA